MARPRTVTNNVRLVFWVMVELMRDRQTGKRDTVNAACGRVGKHLAKCFLGGRHPDFETIRGHHKKFEQLMRRSNSGDEAQAAYAMLENARRRRDLLEWQIDTWALVLDPQTLRDLGYNVVVVHRD